MKKREEVADAEKKLLENRGSKELQISLQRKCLDISTLHLKKVE